MAMDASRLRVAPVFDALTDEELERAARLFEETELLAGSSLIRGDFSYRFFVVLDGEVDVSRDFELIRRLGRGEICGEIGLLTGRRRSARVLAHTRCRVATLMTWDFAALMEQAPRSAGDSRRSRTSGWRPMNRLSRHRRTRKASRRTDGYGAEPPRPITTARRPASPPRAAIDKTATVVPEGDSSIREVLLWHDCLFVTMLRSSRRGNRDTTRTPMWRCGPIWG